MLFFGILLVFLRTHELNGIRPWKWEVKQCLLMSLVKKKKQLQKIDMVKCENDHYVYIKMRLILMPQF